jgi:hypothetical protein
MCTVLLPPGGYPIVVKYIILKYIRIWYRAGIAQLVIATRYGLEGHGIESHRGRDFPHPSRPALEPTQPPIQWVPGLFLLDKAARTWRWPPTPSSVKIKGRVELYLYSPSVASWPVLGWLLHLPLYIWYQLTLFVIITKALQYLTAKSATRFGWRQLSSGRTIFKN